MHLLVIYDIADDRRLRKIARLLRGYGRRVQKSAFECFLSEESATRLLTELRELGKAGDSIRGYRISAVCAPVSPGKLRAQRRKDAPGVSAVSPGTRDPDRNSIFLSPRVEKPFSKIIF